MPTQRSWFVHQENIREFERKLASEVDPARRKLLEELLAQERAHLLPRPKDDTGPGH